MKTSLLLLVASALSSVSATFSSRTLSNALLARQSIGVGSGTDGISTQCNSACEAITDIEDNCGETDLQCICTSNPKGPLTSCFDCGAGASPDSLGSLQSLANELSTGCAQFGVQLGTITISASGGSGGAFGKSAAVGVASGRNGMALGMGALAVACSLVL